MKKIKYLLIVIVMIPILYLCYGFALHKIGSYYYEKKDFSQAKHYYSLASKVLFFSSTPKNRIWIINENERLKNELAEKIKNANILATHTPTPTPTKKPMVVNKKNIPTQKPSLNLAPQPSLGYTELNCPKIIKMEDNLGNSANGSYLKSSFKKDINILTIKITAVDPNNKTIYYSFRAMGGFNDYEQQPNKDSSPDNFFTVNIVNPPLGSNKTIFIRIDNKDEYDCSGSGGSSGVIQYDITP